MNFDEQMNRGGALFWAVTVVAVALAYAALWVVMALPELVGVA